MTKRISIILVLGIICTILTVTFAPAHGQLQVDFGVADPAAGPEPGNPNDVQAGWEEFSVPPSNPRVGEGPVTPGPESRTYGGITVTVTGNIVDGSIPSNNGFTSRDRIPDEGGPLGDMLEDVFGDVGAITIAGLPAGTYEVTSWHHDSAFGQFQTDVLVDGVDTGVDAVTTHNNPNFPNPPGGVRAPPYGSATFNITSDGASDIVISYPNSMQVIQGTPGPGINLSGLEIVPEPGTITLVLLGLISSFGLHRRRRR